jgi:hypothetical protein
MATATASKSLCHGSSSGPGLTILEQGLETAIWQLVVGWELAGSSAGVCESVLFEREIGYSSTLEEFEHATEQKKRVQGKRVEVATPKSKL